MVTARIGDVRLEVDGWEPPHNLKLTMTAKVLSKVDETAWYGLIEQRRQFAQKLADAFAKVFVDFVAEGTDARQPLKDTLRVIGVDMASEPAVIEDIEL